MPIGRPEREPLPAGLLGAELPVDEVLYEALAPIVYLTHTSQGQPLLAYVADDWGEDITTLLAPASPVIVTALKRGALGLREALASSWLWMHRSTGVHADVWTVNLEDLPDSHLPLPGTALLPEHQPVFRTRAIGEKVALGRMPASVVAFVADRTRLAFKTILDFQFETRGEGRPTEEHRALYDLPVQQFSFSSFELSFGAPDGGGMPHDEVRQAADLLTEGLHWAGDVDNGDPIQGESDGQRAAILRAVLYLTPPLTGPIEEVHVSGDWVRGERIRLTRGSRRKAKAELRTVDQDHIVTYNGRIGEIDVDNLTFTLRDTDDGQDRKGWYQEELKEDVLLYVSDGVRVTVAGIERQGRLHVAAVAPFAPPADSVATHRVPA